MAPDRPPMNWGGDLRFWVQATLLWLAISASGVLLAVRRRA
jgi:hypothetical protein